MGRKAINAEVHTDDIKIDQKAPLINDGRDREPEIVIADKPITNDYADALAFFEEPVTIRLEPASEKNAARHIPVWVNGKGCEVLINGSWFEMPYLPVSQTLTIKRKYLEVLARAKSDQVTTKHDDVGAEYIDNRVDRITTAAATFSVLKDSDRGHAWLQEIRRRNY